MFGSDMTKGLSLAALLSAALLTIFFAAPAHACLALAMAEPATFRLSSTLSVSTASGTYGGAATLFATVSKGCTPIIGRTVAFTLNGTSVWSATPDRSRTATLFASLGRIGAGVHGTGARAPLPKTPAPCRGTPSYALQPLGVRRRPLPGVQTPPGAAASRRWV